MPTNNVDQLKLPILYSFRRCPYAIRARLALIIAQVNVQIREVRLSNKPPQMLEASPKGTVPILQLQDGTIIDESLDIISWAHSFNNETMSWQQENELVQMNDNEFKLHLDRYKYFEKHNSLPQSEHRKQCLPFLMLLESKLSLNKYLLGDQAGFVDVAIMPFIRQFSKVDEAWFNSSNFLAVRSWLDSWSNRKVFNLVMQKYQPWQVNSAPIFLI